jgi:hypothetical protein
VTVSGAYIWSTAHSDTDGALCASSFGCGTSTPVNPYDLAAEWSRSALDVENRMFLFGTSERAVEDSAFSVRGGSAAERLSTSPRADLIEFDGLADGSPQCPAGLCQRTWSGNRGRRLTDI